MCLQLVISHRAFLRRAWRIKNKIALGPRNRYYCSGRSFLGESECLIRFLFEGMQFFKAKKNCFCHLYWYVYFLSGQIGLLLCIVCCGASVDSENCEQMEMTKSKAMLWQSAERAMCRWWVAEDNCHWQCRLLVAGKWEAFCLFYVTFTSLLASYWSKLTCLWKHWVVLTGKYVWREDEN